MGHAFRGRVGSLEFAVLLGAARPKSNVTVRDRLAKFQTDTARMGKSKPCLRQLRVSVPDLPGVPAASASEVVHRRPAARLPP